MPAGARQVIHIGTFGHRQKHGAVAYHQIEEGQTSAMPQYFPRNVKLELRELTGKRGSLTPKLKSVLAKNQISH